jgi:hypothetical protein
MWSGRACALRVQNLAECAAKMTEFARRLAFNAECGGFWPQWNENLESDRSTESKKSSGS